MGIPINPVGRSEMADIRGRVEKYLQQLDDADFVRVLSAKTIKGSDDFRIDNQNAST